MKIKSVNRVACEDNITVIFVETEENEVLHVGDEITIQLLDGTFVKREIYHIEIHKEIKGFKYRRNIAVETLGNGEEGDIFIEHTILIPYEGGVSIEEYQRRLKIIDLTPYKEIHCGKESIYDNVEEGFSVPDKVVLYLRTNDNLCAAPGIYEHPFMSGRNLFGPYISSDDIYAWERDTWKYVLKYGLKLPQSFIDYVMSEEGTKYIENYAKKDKVFSEILKKYNEDPKNLTVHVEGEDGIPYDEF